MSSIKGIAHFTSSVTYEVYPKPSGSFVNRQETPKDSSAASGTGNKSAEPVSEAALKQCVKALNVRHDVYIDESSGYIKVFKVSKNSEKAYQQSTAVNVSGDTPRIDKKV